MSSTTATAGSATTVDGLLREQHASLTRLDGFLRARQAAVVRKALASQGRTLSATELGRWGTATRERTLLLLGHNARAMARAQSEDLGVGLHEVVRASQKQSAGWLSSLDKAFLGTTLPLQWNTLAWATTTANELVESRLRTFHASFARYGAAVVGGIEKALSKVATGASWNEVRAEIGKLAAAQVEDKGWMVDRIVRTEASNAYNATTQRALLAEDSPKSPMAKKLVAVFDLVTGQDSYLLHGQVRPVKEMFFDSYHGFHYMHPPNRPNDREIMVGWRLAYGDDKVVAKRKRARKVSKKVERVEPEKVESAAERQRNAARAFDAVRAMESKLLSTAVMPTAGLEGQALALAEGHNLAVAVRQSAIAKERKAVQRIARQAPPKPPAPPPRPPSPSPKKAVKGPKPAGEQASARLRKELVNFEKGRVAVLDAAADALGPDARKELGELRARQAAVTGGRRGVTPAGRVVTDPSKSQAQRDAWVASLTEEQRKAVYDWSTEQWFKSMRMVDSGRDAAGSVHSIKIQGTRGIKNDAQHVLEAERKLTAFREALAKAPRFEGQVSRGLRDMPATSALRKALDTPGAVIELDAVSSWSADEWESRGFAADGEGSYLLVVKTKRGAVISDERVVNVAAEAEVMIDKGARFRVKSSKLRKGDEYRKLVVLEEIDPV